MASNVTRDHHNLRRNLKLNGNYISNDGGDEGILVSDTGEVELTPSQVTIDRNVVDTSSDNIYYRALLVDFDKTGASTGNNNTFGIDIDVRNVNSTDGINIQHALRFKSTLKHAADAGTPANYAAWFEATGDTNGTSFAEACRLIATGATTCTGLRIVCDDGGNDLVIESSADSGDYCKVAVGAAGATTISTVDDDGATANLTLDVDGDIILDASGADIYFKKDDDSGLVFSNGGGIYTIANLANDQDLVFKIKDDNVLTEVMRLDGSESSLLIASGKKIEFGDAGENISGDGTDLTIASGADINLTCATGDVNIPTDIGLTFGDDGEKIEGDGTNLTIASSGHLDLAITGEVDFNASTAGFTKQTATGDGTTTIDWTLGNKFHFTFGSQDETITFGTDPTNACNLVLMLEQDGTGSRTVTWAVTSGKTIFWQGGGYDNDDEPTLTTTASKKDIISLYYDGVAYYGVASLDFKAT